MRTPSTDMLITCCHLIPCLHLPYNIFPKQWFIADDTFHLMRGVIGYLGKLKMAPGWSFSFARWAFTFHRQGLSTKRRAKPCVYACTVHLTLGSRIRICLLHTVVSTCRCQLGHEHETRVAWSCVCLVATLGIENTLVYTIVCTQLACMWIHVTLYVRSYFCMWVCITFLSIFFHRT